VEVLHSAGNQQTFGRKGNFWQKEHFDPVVRNADEMSR
jgi:hypothetical protein